MDLTEALQLAAAKKLDIVEVNPQATPPVARMMDFKKFKYQQNKKTTKKRQVKLKSVRFSIRTSSHDLATKINQIKKFLNQGHKVKIQLYLRGREKSHPGFAREKLDNFLAAISSPYIIEQSPRRQPSGITLLIRKDKPCVP